MSPEEIEKNAKTYRDQAVKVLDPEKTNFVPNSTWLSKLSFGDIMKLASKYNLGRMLERRDFKNRFEEGRQIALHEFFLPDSSKSRRALALHQIAFAPVYSSFISRGIHYSLRIRPHLGFLRCWSSCAAGTGESNTFSPKERGGGVVVYLTTKT